MVKYLLDSSVIIEAIRLHNVGAEEFLRTNYKGRLYLTYITVAELFSGRSAQDKEIEKFLKYLIGSFKLVALDLETSILTGQMRSLYKMSLPDAFIAASAINNGLVLITHDTKDFTPISKLKVLRP